MFAYVAKRYGNGLLTRIPQVQILSYALRPHSLKVMIAAFQVADARFKSGWGHMHRTVRRGDGLQNHWGRFDSVTVLSVLEFAKAKHTEYNTWSSWQKKYGIGNSIKRLFSIQQERTELTIAKCGADRAWKAICWSQSKTVKKDRYFAAISA